jgi:hypothetical protein
MNLSYKVLFSNHWIGFLNKKFLWGPGACVTFFQKEPLVAGGIVLKIGIR